MAVVEVASDVIACDRREPQISLGFTDRVMGALKPQEPKVVRIVRLRRVAAVLGPILSAAAVWMFVASAIRPVDMVKAPSAASSGNVAALIVPQTAAAIEVAAPVNPQITLVDTLAEGILTPALSAWRDTQQSTRDLVALGRMVLGTAGQSLSTPLQDGATEGSERGLWQAEAVLKSMMAPRLKGETVEESPDVL